MAMLQRRSTTDRVIAGLVAQFERTSKFQDSLDLGAAFVTYGRVTELLRPQLPELRVAAGLPAVPGPFAAIRARLATKQYAELPVPTDRIYTFWDKPIDAAPPLVQACVAQLRAVYPHAQVLDGVSARELVEIPARIAGVLEPSRPAHFTDYVRTRILEEHGGVWVDATTWVHRNLDAELPKYLRGGTVFPRWTKGQIANWFIASHPRTPLISLQRLALEAWWEANDDLPDYFLYHRIFEVLRALVPEFRGQWGAAPGLSSVAAHLLQVEMMQPWHPGYLRAMLDAAPLQKLSYKYDDVPAGSVLEHLIAGDLLGE